MLVTLLGRVMLLRLLQAWNALLPMLVTLLGIVMLSRLLQPMNALLPMLVTLLGIMVFLHPAIRVFVAVSIIALQLSRLSYTLFFWSTIKVSRLLQYSNAPFPMLVTLFGIVMLARLLQYSNAPLPMLVTLLGISMLASLLQS